MLKWIESTGKSEEAAIEAARKKEANEREKGRIPPSEGAV